MATIETAIHDPEFSRDDRRKKVGELMRFVLDEPEVLWRMARFCAHVLVLPPSSGMSAYRGLTYLSWLAAPDSVRALVDHVPDFIITLQISTAPHVYPCSNIVREPVWKNYDPQTSGWEVGRRYRFVDEQGIELRTGAEPEMDSAQVQVLERVETVPYGGKESPLMVHFTWEESFVAVLAHEIHHVMQYLRNEPLSESACEIYADRRLTEFRKSIYKLS